ncbi:hypothetical protein J2S11_001711 [Bacillus horti]|uniref:Uncharacterized protein n=1 Tax=Caldalkalibacillus horti TaxID=77523 RepID=A0ABT9VYX8_9BACI|nr:hypothetical protein [Bacillus horti]
MRKFNMNNPQKGENIMQKKRIMIYENTKYWSTGPC